MHVRNRVHPLRRRRRRLQRCTRWQVVSSLAWQYSIALCPAPLRPPRPKRARLHTALPFAAVPLPRPRGGAMVAHGAPRSRPARSVATVCSAAPRRRWPLCTDGCAARAGTREQYRVGRGRYWAYRAMITQELTNAPNSIGRHRPYANACGQSRACVRPMPHALQGNAISRFW